MNNVKLEFFLLNEKAVIPSYGSGGASGLDLSSTDFITVLPGQTVKVQTGVVFIIPEGYEIQVRPRSGMSLKTKMRIVNTPGTVDQDYRGECCVLMENTGNEPYKINRGDRVAQAVLCPIVRPQLIMINELPQTSRGSSGFGSTGV